MVRVKVGKKDFFWIGLVVVLFGIGLVYGYGGSNPLIVGHNISEVDGVVTEAYVNERIVAALGSGGTVAKNNCYWKTGESCLSGEVMTGYFYGSSESGIYCCKNGQDSESYCSASTSTEVVSSCNACGPGVCGNHNGEKILKTTIISKYCSVDVQFRAESCSMYCGECRCEEREVSRREVGCSFYCQDRVCGGVSGKNITIVSKIRSDCSVYESILRTPCTGSCGDCEILQTCKNGKCEELSLGIPPPSVICTEAHRQGYLSHKLYEADKEFAERNIDRETFLGYHSWGRPVARLMSKDKRVADIIIPLTIGWAEHMAYSVGGDNDSEIGELLMDVGLPVCRELGEMMIEDGRTDYEFDEKFVRERVLFYLDRYDVEALSDDSVKMEFKEDMKLFFEDLKSVYLSEKSNDLLNSEFSSFEFLA